MSEWKLRTCNSQVLPGETMDGWARRTGKSEEVYVQPALFNGQVVNDRLISRSEEEVPYISANIGNIFGKQESKQPMLNADGSESVYVSPDLGSVLKEKPTANEQKAKPAPQQNQTGEQPYTPPTLSGTLAGKTQKRK